MMKCLAPILLIASTVQPHAEMCPVFRQHEHFTCQTFGEDDRPTAVPPFPLRVKAGQENGRMTIEARSPDSGNRFVVGQRLETSDHGNKIVGTAECGTFKGRNDKSDPAIFARVANADGSLVSEMAFYPQKGGIVRIIFGKTRSGAWGQIQRNSCKWAPDPKPAGPVQAPVATPAPQPRRPTPPPR